MNSLEYCRIMRDAEKRKMRSGGEIAIGNNINKIFESDKIKDDDFCEKILIKLINKHAEIIEENANIIIKELKIT